MMEIKSGNTFKPSTSMRTHIIIVLLFFIAPNTLQVFVGGCTSYLFLDFHALTTYCKSIVGGGGAATTVGTFLTAQLLGDQYDMHNHLIPQ